MALNTYKCNYLTSLHFKGLIVLWLSLVCVATFVSLSHYKSPMLLLCTICIGQVCAIRLGLRLGYRLALRFVSGLGLGQICKFRMHDFKIVSRILQIVQTDKSRATFPSLSSASFLLQA